MPKFRRVKSPSVGRSSSYPYPSNSYNNEEKHMNSLGSVEDMTEWEEAKCPICLDPPHNAVLLKCSSVEMGCRPFMCNTSQRHSNCLDKFCKTFDPDLSSATLQEIPLSSIASLSSDVQTESQGASLFSSQLQHKIICPLCRGEIHGYMVLEPARRHMNSIPRSCSSETCEFQGTYSELRKHARSEHPHVRPSEVDASRMSDWERMEEERGLNDLFSSINASSDIQYDDSDTVSADGLASLMSSFIDEVFTSIQQDARRITQRLSDPRVRVPLHDRRSATTHRVYHTVTNQPAIWRSNLPDQYVQQIQRVPRIRRSSSFLLVEATHTTRPRTNLSSSRMPRDVHDHHRDSGTNLSSSRMPRDVHDHHRDLNPGSRATSRIMMPIPPGSEFVWTNTQRNGSSSRRSGHQLRWRDQRWSSSNNQP